jgi:hypothetical protein
MTAEGLIRHEIGACLELSEDHHKIYMNKCDPNILRQHWTWKVYEKTVKTV